MVGKICGRGTNAAWSERVTDGESDEDERQADKWVGNTVTNQQSSARI